MNDDLISRAAAIDALTDTELRRNLDSVYDGDMNRTRRAAHRVIAQLPAVEAVPVVHSCWKQTDAYPHWLYCLNCYRKIVPNVEWIEQYNIPTNYCPNCGVKMDE